MNGNGGPTETDHEDLPSPLDWSFIKDGHLYDRETQIEKIHRSFLRCLMPGSQNELILVSGRSGTGKTALATALKDPVVAKCGFFIMGKFDQLKRPEPYSAFVAAFTDYAGQLEARGVDTITAIRNAIIRDVGTDVHLLMELLPALKGVLGISSEPVTVKGTTGMEAQTRLRVTLRNFVRCICSRECPLVLLMDDLQWADSGSLDLLDVLISDDINQGLVVVGICRSNEVSFSSNFASMLRQLEDEKNTHITNIVVGNLSTESTASLISDVLKISQASCEVLARIIYGHTEGNVFFILQLLQSLYEDGILIPCHMQDQWVWDENAVRNYKYGEDVVSLVARKIERLSDTMQTVLTTAACMGSDIDGYLLSKVLVDFDVNEAINIAVLGGAICRGQRIGKFAFCHDKIQQAAYSLIANNQKALIHLSIGRRLLEKLAVEEIEQHIFVVVNQLGLGICHIHDRSEKVSTASLCLRAGKKAILSSDFKLAATYFWLGIGLLDKVDWKDQYGLCLELYNSAAEAEYCSANFDQMDFAVNEVLANARYFGDKICAYSTQVYSLGARMMFQEAIDLGLNVLSHVGEKFPSKLHIGNLLLQVIKVRRLLSGKTNSDILELPNIEDRTKTAAMGLLNLITTYTFVGRKQLFPYIVTRMVTLSLKYGLCTVSAFAFGAYGLLCCGLGNFETGYRFGKLSLSILEKYGHGGIEWLPRVHFIFYGMVSPWRDPARTSADHLICAHRIAMETGDIEFGVIASHSFCLTGFICGMPLADLEKHLTLFMEVAGEYKQDSSAMLLAPLLQMVHNFAGGSSDPLVLTGDAMNQEEDMQVAIEKQYDSYLWQVTLWRLILAYYFDDLDLALEMANKTKQHFKRVTSHLLILGCFYYGLTALSAAWNSEGKKRKQYISNSKQAITRMRKFAKMCPQNCMHKFLLMEAELEALKGKKDAAITKYNLSIDMADDGNYLQEKALACERAGYAALHLGEKDSSDAHLRVAVSLYRDWGAFAKANKVEGSLDFVSSNIIKRGCDEASFKTANSEITQ